MLCTGLTCGKQKPDPPWANRVVSGGSASFFVADNFAKGNFNGDNFAEDSDPASTVLTVRAEVRFARCVVAIILLTRFRRERLLSET